MREMGMMVRKCQKFVVPVSSITGVPLMTMSHQTLKKSRHFTHIPRSEERKVLS